MFLIALLVVPIKCPKEMFKIGFIIRVKTFTTLSMLFQSTLTEVKFSLILQEGLGFTEVKFFIRLNGNKYFIEI